MSTTAGVARREREVVPRHERAGAGLALVALLVFVGVIVRFVIRSPLWLDEALSVNLARLPVGELADALRHDGHPALYYVLLGGWIDLFGGGDGAVRSLSGVASLATVPPLWAATRLRFGRRAAVHVAVLAVTSPFLIRYGSESRMYALLGLVVALGWWAIESARIDPTRGRFVAIAVASALAVHTHYWAIWLVATVWVVAIVEWRRGRPDQRPVAGRIAVAVAAGASTLLLWAPVLIDQVNHTGTPWADRARPAEIAVETVEAVGGGMRFEPVLLGVLLVMAATVGALTVESTKDRISLGTRLPVATAGLAIVIVGTLLSGGIVAMATGGGYEARYAAVVVPMLLALVARATSLLQPLAGYVALVLLAVLGLAVAIDDARRDRTQGEDVANLIDELATPGDIVVFCPDQLAPATIRSLDHAGDRFTYPPTPDPRFVDWYDYLDRVRAIDPVAFAAEVDAGAGETSIWLVMMTSYRGFDSRCETISATLATSRAQQTLLVGSTAFEPMFLQRFGPPS